MTNVSFYQVPGDYHCALLLACELTIGAIRTNRDVLLHVPDAAAGRQLDELLSNHNKGGVCVHSVASEPRNSVSISWGDDPSHHHGLLINLHPASTAHWFSRFDKLIEIVYDDPAVTEHKRVQYRYYRDRGYPLGFHQQISADATA